MKRALSRILKFVGVAIFSIIGLAIAINLIIAPKPETKHYDLSTQQIVLFSSYLMDDYLLSRDAEKTLIAKEQWDQILSISGHANARKIIADFEENEVSSHQKYKGKWIVRGKVFGIHNDIKGATVFLDNQYQIGAFNAKINDMDFAASLSKGDIIEVVCNDIDEAVTIIYGDDCEAYNSWITAEIKFLTLNPNRFLNSIQENQTRENFNKFLDGISMLQTDSACYDDFKSTECKAEFQSIHENTLRDTGET